MSNSKFKVPHTFVLLFLIALAMAIATYFVPAGEFKRVVDPVTKRTIVVAGSYHLVKPSPVGIFDFFIDFQRGMIDAANIIFFIIFAYGYVYMIVKSGALLGAVKALLAKMEGKEKLLIPIFMIFFGICGSTYGMFEETYGLIPVFVGIAIAMGYDAIVGLSMVGLGVGVGFASATTNPFTVGIAQTIAQLPLFSGISYRILIFVVMEGVAIWWTMKYAERVKKDPRKSIVSDINFSALQFSQEEMEKARFGLREKIVFSTFPITIVLIVFGSLKLGWYINELAGLLFIMMIITGFLAGWSPNKIASNWVEAGSQVTFGALAVGVARTILIVMNQGHITDTIIYSIAQPLQYMGKYLSATGMLVVQNLINFLIPSGSGQAVVSMPIMAPLADLSHLTRQVAVLAYQFGDGYSNLLWPTAGAVVMCGMIDLPLDRWWRFFVPLFGIIFLLQVIFLLIAVAIGYGP